MRFLNALWVLAAATPLTLAAPTQGHSLTASNVYDDTPNQPLVDHTASSQYNQDADQAIHDLISKDSMSDDSSFNAKDEEEEDLNIPSSTYILSQKKPIPTTFLMQMTQDEKPDTPPARPTPSQSFSRVLPPSFSLSGGASSASKSHGQRKACSSPKTDNSESSSISDSDCTSEVTDLLHQISNHPLSVLSVWTVITVLFVFVAFVSTVVAGAVIGACVASKARRVIGLGDRCYPCRTIQLRGSERRLCARPLEKEDLTCVDVA